MCYTFDLLGPQFSAAHVRSAVQAFEAAVVDGWVCWAFSNHDVDRHASRWAIAPGDVPAVARFSIALLVALRGAICLYQGEELGLPQAELAFDDLRDPYGIRFWPGYKGRDGSRTPMVWSTAAENAGFCTVKPWLPVPAAHLPLAGRPAGGRSGDSVLERYRQALAFRRAHPALQTGTIRFLAGDEPVLALIREAAEETLLCVFNFSAEATQWVPPAGLGPVARLDFPGRGRLHRRHRRAAGLWPLLRPSRTTPPPTPEPGP